MTFEEIKEQFAIENGYVGWHEIEDDHKLGDVCEDFAKFCLVENIAQSESLSKSLFEIQGNAEIKIEFTEKKIKDFVIRLRKMQKDIEQKISFCKQHNLRLDAESKRNEADLVQRIIHEMENEFDLGFVWDSSLD